MRGRCDIKGLNDSLFVRLIQYSEERANLSSGNSILGAVTPDRLLHGRLLRPQWIVAAQSGAAGSRSSPPVVLWECFSLYIRRSASDSSCSASLPSAGKLATPTLTVREVPPNNSLPTSRTTLRKCASFASTSIGSTPGSST